MVTFLTAIILITGALLDYRKQPQKQPERPLLTPELRQAFNDIGRRLPQVWAAGVLSPAQKKSLLRCLVDKVVLDKPVREQVQVRIVWRGGDHTTLTLPIVVISLPRCLLPPR